MGGFCGDIGWDGDCGGGGSKCSGGDDGNCSDIALDDKGSVELRWEVSWKIKDWVVNSDAVVFSCLKNKLILLVARFFSCGLCRSLFTWAEEYIFEVMLWLFPDVFGLPRWPVISTDCLKVNTERLVDTSSILIYKSFYTNLP